MVKRQQRSRIQRHGFWKRWSGILFSSTVDGDAIGWCRAVKITGIGMTLVSSVTARKAKGSSQTVNTTTVLHTTLTQVAAKVRIQRSRPPREVTHQCFRTGVDDADESPLRVFFWHPFPELLGKAACSNHPNFGFHFKRLQVRHQRVATVTLAPTWPKSTQRRRASNTGELFDEQLQQAIVHDRLKFASHPVSQRSRENRTRPTAT